MLNNKYQQNYSSLKSYSLPYTASELLAISLGYCEVSDHKAYNGRYFILNGKKWIHNLEALRRKLKDQYCRYITDEELEAYAPEGFGYDVQAYYEYVAPKGTHLTNRKDFKSLMQQMRVMH